MNYLEKGEVSVSFCHLPPPPSPLYPHIQPISANICTHELAGRPLASGEQEPSKGLPEEGLYSSCTRGTVGGGGGGGGSQFYCWKTYNILLPSHTKGPAYLTFTIGSMESFERSLEQAQRDLGIDPVDQVPVFFVNETDWLTELFKFFPTILMLGALVFLGRRLSSGASGRGVSVLLCLLIMCVCVRVYM